MKTPIFSTIFISLLFVSTPSLADDIQYICWENSPVVIAKNQILFKLHPDYTSESDREKIYDNVKSEISEDVEFDYIGLGWVFVLFHYDLDDIRVEIRTLLSIEGIQYAEPNFQVIVQKDLHSPVSLSKNGTKSVDNEGLITDSEAFDFGDVFKKEVGCHILTITNTTDVAINAQLRISEADSNSFKLLAGISFVQILPDSSLQLEIEFRPDSIRSYTSTLKIDHDLIGQPSISIPISGNGMPGSTSIETIKQLPNRITLEQNYPNPFNPSTQIRYAIVHQSHVNLAIYNTLGEKIATLVNETKSSGWHQVSFNASELSSGTFIYRLETEDNLVQRLMTFIK